VSVKETAIEVSVCTAISETVKENAIE
jgi:hypothetical protein